MFNYIYNWQGEQNRLQELKEHLEMKKKTAKLRCPMFLVTENITSQCLRILYICIAQKKFQYFLYHFRPECSYCSTRITNLYKMWLDFVRL